MASKTEARLKNYEKMISESIKAETEANRAKAPTADRLRRRRPVVVYVLLVFQVSLFFLAALSPSTYEYLKTTASLIPSQIMSGQNLHSLITYIFFSPSISDPSSVFEGIVLVTYILLYVILLLGFGRSSETVFGGLAFVASYLLCGIMGGLFHSAISVVTSSLLADVNMLGASASLFGVVASYGIFFPTRNFTIRSMYLERLHGHFYIKSDFPTFEARIPTIIVVTVLIVIELTITVFLFPRGLFFPIGNIMNTGGFISGVTFSLLFRISGMGPWKEGIKSEMEYELAEHG